MTNISVSFRGSCVKLVYGQTHLVGERGDASFHKLDIFTVQTLEARIILVQYASQAIKIVAGAANIIGCISKEVVCRQFARTLRLHGDSLLLLCKLRFDAHA